MRLKPLLLFQLFLLAETNNVSAQADYTHIELQCGYELSSYMSNKSGVSLNMGGRYAFSERYFVAALVHCGINNGTYKGIYAGETTDLKHTLREYMIGAGPGIYLYNGGNKWIYADVFVGYGFGEERKASENSTSRSLNGFATAVQVGVERQTKGGWILGVNMGGHLIGGKVSPTVCLKCGALFSIF